MFEKLLFMERIRKPFVMGWEHNTCTHKHTQTWCLLPHLPKGGLFGAETTFMKGITVDI